MTALTDPLSLRARRILVVAPHPDDEALGCGGLIAMLRGDGRTVKVVFVTDGGASHPGSRDWPRWRLAARRREEALDALRLFGVPPRDAHFLGLEDAGMPPAGSVADRDAVDALARLIADLAPELVLMPWRRDPHCDHRDAWRLTQDALDLAGRPALALEYAVWLDELGAPGDHPQTDEARRIVFDITPAVDAKRLAVAAHVSQTTDLIRDDPDGFRLTPETIDRLCGPHETYWRPLS